MGEDLDEWGYEAIEELYRSFPDDETLSELAELIDSSDFKGTDFELNDTGEVRVDKNFENDFNSRNLRSMANTISLLADYREKAFERLVEFAPSLVEDIDNDFYENLIESKTQINGFAYEVENFKDSGIVADITLNAPGISLYVKDSKCYIASNSSEFDKVQTAYAAMFIDDRVFKELKDEISVNDFKRSGLSETGIYKLKKTIEETNKIEFNKMCDELAEKTSITEANPKEFDKLAHSSNEKMKLG